MKTAAVLPALGIGDALLMMIASHQLKRDGYQVTTFHPALPELSSWFPGHEFCPAVEDLAHFDLIVVENDNTPKIKELIDVFRPRLSIFYPTYSSSKHAPLSIHRGIQNLANGNVSASDLQQAEPLAKQGMCNHMPDAASCKDEDADEASGQTLNHDVYIQDFAFDPNLSMADNIAEAVASLLDLPVPFKENGIVPLPGLVHRLKKEQILIHPMSRVPAKNWKAEKFLKLARKLKSNGFQPLFCVGPTELSEWKKIEAEGFALADAPTLSDLASIVYESGYVIGNDSLTGHLGSNLRIPTLIIANDEKRMRLWRPGWRKGQLVLPPPYLPNWKFLRLREQKWQNFISVNKVLAAFDDLVGSF